MGMYIGVGLSSLSELLDEKYGWRNSIIFIGVISLIFAWTNVFLTEPKRNETSKDLVALVERKDSDSDYVSILV